VAQLDLYRGPPRSSYLLVLTRAQARHAGLDLADDVVSAERADGYTCPPLWPGSVGSCGPGDLWAWERPADEGAGPAVMPLLARGWAVVVEDTARRSEVCQRLARAGWPVRYRTGKGLRVYSAPPKIRRPEAAPTTSGHNPRHKEEHRGTHEG